MGAYISSPELTSPPTTDKIVGKEQKLKAKAEPPSRAVSPPSESSVSPSSESSVSPAAEAPAAEAPAAEAPAAEAPAAEAPAAAEQKNFTDVYGKTNFISFQSTIYARLAYCSARNFLKYYGEIFGPIITSEMLEAINAQVKNNGIKSIMNDEQMFGLTDNDNKFGLGTYTFNGNKYLKFLPLADKINIALGEKRISASNANCHFNLENYKKNDNLIFVQIANSNYGGIYVFGDKRMPNLITILFRGTYSIKSAASYTKVSSLKPGLIGAEGIIPEKYLTGIFKLISENIHLIIYAMRYVSNQLGPNEEKKILTTGHSLGGALTAIFAYLWVNHITANIKYRVGDYALLDQDVFCVSFSSPRVFGKELANLFCCLTDNNGDKQDNPNEKCLEMLIKNKEAREKHGELGVQGRIYFLKVSTNRDPVTGLPAKGWYQHPCSDINTTDSIRREAVTMNCLPQIKESISKRCWKKNKSVRVKLVPDRLAITMDLKMPLDCVSSKSDRDESKHKTPKLKNTMGYHIMIMGISFAGALDPTEFFKVLILTL